MAWSFNPFTGNLDLVGGGAVVFEGEVETFADLPETIGDPAVGASFLVRSSTGVWLVNRRQAGIWIRRNNTGVRATDWEYGGDYPVNSVNGQTGNVSLGSSDVAAEPIDYTVVTTAQTLINGAKVAADTTAGAFTLTLPATPANGDTVSILDYAGTFDTNNLTIARNGSNIESLAEDMDCNIEDAAFSLVFVGSTVGWKVVPYFGNKTNFASPDPIGSVVPNSGAFTTLTANNGTQSIVAPALSAETTWNDEAVFVANTSGGTMTVTSMISGTIQVGQEITAGDLIGTVITGLGTGTGGTGTYTVNINSTRNNITFTTKQRMTGFLVNATDTNSGAYSRIADFASDGVSRFSILKSGNINLDVGSASAARIFTSGNQLLISSYGANDINQFTDDVRFLNGSIFLRANIGWGNNSVTGADLLILRDAAGTLAQRNGTNPQTFNIYNTFTNASNYERGFMRWSSNVLQIGTEAAGTGSARNMVLRVPANRSMFIDSDTIDLRTAGFSTILRLTSGLVQFGGTTSSFPALKRSSTTLQVRLADDTDFTAIQGKLTTETAYTAGAPTATGYLVLYDSNGTAYKVPAEAL